MVSRVDERIAPSLDALVPLWRHLVPFWFRYVVHFPVGRLTFGIKNKDVSGRNAA